MFEDDVPSAGLENRPQFDLRPLQGRDPLEFWARRVADPVLGPQWFIPARPSAGGGWNLGDISRAGHLVDRQIPPLGYMPSGSFPARAEEPMALPAPAQRPRIFSGPIDEPENPNPLAQQDPFSTPDYAPQQFPPSFAPARVHEPAPVPNFAPSLNNPVPGNTQPGAAPSGYPGAFPFGLLRGYFYGSSQTRYGSRRRRSTRPSRRRS